MSPTSSVPLPPPFADGGVQSAQVVTFRSELTPSDGPAIAEILRRSRFFNESEIRTALELVADRLQKGNLSEYQFLMAESGGRLIGYSCFSIISCTQSSWDLHWIAVDVLQQRGGLGRRLLAASEGAARSLGATRMYADTSGRALYQPTRTFYERCGYDIAATLPDFYAPGDAKIVYLKKLVPE